MPENITYPCTETYYVKFDDIRIAKLRRVEWILESQQAQERSAAASLAINDALETVRSILAEVGG